MKEETRTRKRRHKRWYARQRVRRVLRVMGALGLVIGAALCSSVLLLHDSKPLKLGIGYLVCSAVLLGWAALMSKMEADGIRRHSSRQPQTEGKHGMAAIMALFFTALLVTLTMEAQVVSGINQRRARVTRRQWELRRAAADAARETLDAIAVSGAGGKNEKLLWDQPFPLQLPSGVIAEVLAQREGTGGRTKTAAASRSAGAFLFNVRADATTDGQSRRVFCRASRQGNGEVRVLSWVEE